MTSIISYCPIDEGCRYLLTDNCGRVYLLILKREKSNESSATRITDMKVIKAKLLFFFNIFCSFSWIFLVKYQLVDI